MNMNKISVVLSVLCLVGCGKEAYTEDRKPAVRAVIVVTETTKECTRSYTQGETPPEWTCIEEPRKDKGVIVVTDDDMPKQAPPPVVIIKKKTK
jgi:hypothetical protein